ncbi:MAG: type II toxin-antitoxin system PemK/MazF family toxin [Chloroflexia bacterium]
MVTTSYVPSRGEIIWLTFDPQAGHEQAGRRPALAVSPANYNGRVGLVLACPITSRRRSACSWRRGCVDRPQRGAVALPPGYGGWNSVYKRFARWDDLGVWERLFAGGGRTTRTCRA